MTDDRRAMLYDARRRGRPARRRRSQAEEASRNRAKVGSGRPSSLLYTYGPGAIMDLPQFTVMPAGLDDWDRIWAPPRRRSRAIHEPRLLRRGPAAPRLATVDELRPFPWQPKRNTLSNEGNDLGVPARVFPQWLRCTGCDLLGPLSRFAYTNTHPFRTDLACFEHASCPGRGGDAARKAAGRTRRARPGTCWPAPTGTSTSSPTTCGCTAARPAPKAELPALKMRDATAGKGAVGDDRLRVAAG